MILQQCFLMKFAKPLRKPILKNICGRLPLFVSPQNTITDRGDKSGLAETSAEYKVFFKRGNFIQSNAAIKFICKLKKVSLTFQLTFLLNF